MILKLVAERLLPPVRIRYAVLLLVGVAFSVAVLSSTLNHRTTEQAIKRDSGSATAAGDLYGLGVRVGLYLQTVGILLSLFSVDLDERRRKRALV
jgi:hypothetical protein